MAKDAELDHLNRVQELTFRRKQLAYNARQRAWEELSVARDAINYANQAKQRAYTTRAQAARLYLSARNTSGLCFDSFKDQRERAVQQASDDFFACKQGLEVARAKHKRASAEFKRAKTESDACTEAFNARLKKVKAESKNRREEKKTIAAKAGVPYQYRNNVWISEQLDGTINIYFGGAGRPNGPGYGHYIVDRNGEVMYCQDPTAHGPSRS